ncbi:Hypothetical protein KpB31_0702 [Klebsiella pneumoniae]|nr:Hypothetical protein KpB31_0702 [Klebsiella pneumoniae]
MLMHHKKTAVNCCKEEEIFSLRLKISSSLQQFTAVFL